MLSSLTILSFSHTKEEEATMLLLRCFWGTEEEATMLLLRCFWRTEEEATMLLLRCFWGTEVSSDYTNFAHTCRVASYPGFYRLQYESDKSLGRPGYEATCRAFHPRILLLAVIWMKGTLKEEEATMLLLRCFWRTKSAVTTQISHTEPGFYYLQ